MLERVEVLKTLLKQDTEISLVICGGKTRKKFDSEAKIILRHLVSSGYLSEKVKVITEEQSRTTAENIKQTKQILNSILPIQIKAITTKESVPRFEYLYKKLWPEADELVNFYSNSNSRKRLKIIENIYYWYTHIDPEYKWLKLPVRIFRNG